MKLSELIKILRIDFESLGVEDTEITAINSLQNATGSELSYCDSEKNEKFIADCKAKAILVKKALRFQKARSKSSVKTRTWHLRF